ncbi:MAG: hypothetical protein IKS69_06980 [Erysipelotrichaceae bacterium]|nr:hypothetical protein [Erysipelotrichaceae bacterium]
MEYQMKTIEEIQEEYPTAYIFTTEEFAELMEPDEDGFSEIEFVDSFGYFHDGEELTEIMVDPYTFDEYKDKYPYVVWRKV